ncbi:MAG: fatty acid desaturase [Streptosporangiaceae bacterium]|nr:fatty acid desaturase [Streptosporangiaceae bacterium]
MIVLPAAVAVWIAPAAPPWLTGCLAALAAFWVGRQLRALENLVHEASHFNWSRQRRAINDVLAVVLAVIPTGAWLSGYRQSHFLHHGRFGSAADPDRRRYSELALEDLSRTQFLGFTVGLSRRFWQYQRGWLGTLGDAPWLTVIPTAWATIWIVLPVWVTQGFRAAGVAAAIWLAAYLLALPIIRFIAESSEHIYRGSTTVFDATVSNLGLVHRLILHPHGDGYHTVHHMWPGVPHHRIARLHRFLMVNDCWYATRLQLRTRVLQTPLRAGSTRSGFVGGWLDHDVPA